MQTKIIKIHLPSKHIHILIPPPACSIDFLLFVLYLRCKHSQFLQQLTGALGSEGILHIKVSDLASQFSNFSAQLIVSVKTEGVKALNFHPKIFNSAFSFNKTQNQIQ